jgi:hypothetical protein
VGTGHAFRDSDLDDAGGVVESEFAFVFASVFAVAVDLVWNDADGNARNAPLMIVAGWTSCHLAAEICSRYPSFIALGGFAFIP